MRSLISRERLVVLNCWNISDFVIYKIGMYILVFFNLIEAAYMSAYVCCIDRHHGVLCLCPWSLLLPLVEKFLNGAVF